MKLLMISTAVLFAIPFLAKAQEPNWLVKLKQQKWMKNVSKIKLLKTNRLEAEQILGKPDPNYLGDRPIPIEFYTTPEGKIDLSYTTQECRSKDGKVAKDVVEEINIRVEPDILFSSLKISLNQFKHSTESDVPSINLYENEQNGIIFDVQFGKLVSIEFYPPKWKKFVCVD